MDQAHKVFKVKEVLTEHKVYKVKENLMELMGLMERKEYKVLI